MNEKPRNNMLMQAGILAAAGLIVRIIGLLYRSPLTSIIGDEGNGYYNVAYNCYSIILLISAYSIPSAISKVIAERLALGQAKKAQRIFHGALLYVLIVSGAFSLLVFFGAGLLTVGNSVTVLRVFSPTILFFGFLGVLRGYFQAHRTMLPTSVSQILEQIVNASVSLLAAWLFIRSAGSQAGTTERAVRGAVGSAMGTGAGVFAALLLLLIIYFLKHGELRRTLDEDRDGAPDSWGSVLKLLFLTVTPFILSTFVYNFSTMLDQTIFQRVLLNIRGLAEREVAVSYGIFSTKAVVIANIPIALSSALSSAMMPNLSASHAQGDDETSGLLVRRALRVTWLISVPCAVGLMVLSRPVMLLLFPQRNSLDEAAALLAGMAVTVVFYSISTVTNAVLQGIGKMHLPVFNAALALILQAVFLGILLQWTGLDNEALVMAAILYSALMCVFNHRSIQGTLELHGSSRHEFIAPLLSSACMGAVAYLVYRGVALLFGQFLTGEYLVNLIALLPAIFFAIETYGLLIVRSGGVTEEELLMMPKGKSIVRGMKKLRILR